LKSQYEARITSLEKELAEVKEAASVNSQMTDLKTNVERLEKEKSELQTKITEQQSKIVELQAKVNKFH